MIILAIETSCDETAVAIVEFKKNKVRVLSNVISSQVKAHSKFGGVMPSLAARMHLKNMVPVLKKAMREAEIFSEGDIPECRLRKKSKIDYIAVTKGPGLIPALTIGVSAAKALAYSLDKPLVGVNHLEGHIYANWLKMNLEFGIWNLGNKKQNKYSGFQNSKFKIQNSVLWKPKFPILCLIVSGGHTQLVLMKKDLDYKIIGETRDDAVGEAFDKVARLLGLSYPGGPLIEKIAKKGDKNKFKFPRPMMYNKDYDFSFSGLKTAVLYEVEYGIWNMEYGIKKKYSNSKFQILNSKYKQDIAASFQEAVVDVLVFKTIKAAKKYKVRNIILGGGVSANRKLRERLENAVNKEILRPRRTSLGLANSSLSTDNALMIAVAGYYNIVNNKNIKTWKNVEADANLKL